MRSSFINTSSFFHAPATAKEISEAIKAKIPAATIEKVVYMSADDSLKSVVLNCGNAADATLRFVAAMVVHLCVRTYHHIDAERRDIKTTSEEILAALKEYAEIKRGAQFKNAWCAKLLATSKLMARALVTDYDKKGVQPGSPLSEVLRAKTAEKGLDIVFTLIMGKTKGANAFSSLERALSPKGPPRNQAGTENGGKNKGSNATKASTDKPERIGAAIMADKGHEIFNAVKGNAKAKAIKIADKVGQSNVDHLAFIMRSLSFLTTEEDLVAVSEAALNLAKELHKRASSGKRGENNVAAKPIAVAS